MTVTVRPARENHELLSAPVEILGKDSRLVKITSLSRPWGHFEQTTADLQTGAIDRVKLPRRQNRHGAARQLHVHQLARGTPLALNTTYPLSAQRMPAISDHNILPDMGRMTARLPSAEKPP